MTVRGAFSISGASGRLRGRGCQDFWELRQGKFEGLKKGGQGSRRADRVRQESYSPTRQSYLSAKCA
jgi:hypothetical protein